MSQSKIQKIGILTSGGDAPGMNACIRAVVRSATHKGIEVTGIRRGYSGLLDADFVKLNSRAVANIIQRGGTVLETSRSEEFKAKKGRRKAIQNLEQEGIEGLVVIGGNGTLQGATALAEESKIKIIGVSSTIDNDIYGTDYTIGFDTAVNTALEAIDRIRDTANSYERIFFVEVMGRDSGFIALEVGVAGGAEEIIIPEVETNLDLIVDMLRQSFNRGKRSSIIVVAEGNEVGHTVEIARHVGYALKTNCRVCVLGYIQRGGSPTAKDRILASKLGTAAIEGLLNSKEGHVVGESKGQIVYIPLRETWTKKKDLDMNLLKSSKVLAL